MMPSRHVAVSGLTSVAFFAMTKSWPGSLACFLSGIFIDIDHVIDYWVIRKKISLSYNDLMAFCNDKIGKIYLIFHSYELLAILWMIAIVFRFEIIWLGLIVGMSVHMLFDQFTNTTNPFTYFWFYRAKLGFPKSLFDVPNLAKEIERK